MTLTKSFLLVATFILGSASSLYGEATSFTHRISVSVEGDNSLVSSLRRAFREFPDVIVTDTTPDSIVKVVVLNPTMNGRPAGIVAAVLVTGAPTDTKEFWSLLEALAECEWKAGKESSWLVGASVSGRVRVLAFDVFTGPANVEDMARRVAAYVDDFVIEPARQAHQQFAPKETTR